MSIALYFVKEVYEEIKNVVKVKEVTDKFWTSQEIRQGCLKLFAILIADLQLVTVFRNGQRGRIVMGRERLWTLAYADNVVYTTSR